MSETTAKQGIVYRMLNWVERVGNKMPDPITIFFILCILVLICSAIFAQMGVSALNPRDGSEVRIINLLNKGELQRFFSAIVNNFQSFPPLGLVLVVMLGVGVAEKTGLMETALKRSIVGLPKGLITFVVMFAGIIANAAGDAGFIVLPPLAAVAFISIGRHPLIGIFAAFAGVAAGFAANIMPNMSDSLAAGFTISAAQLIDPAYNSSPMMNYYFLVVSTLFLVLTGTLVTEKIIAPRFENQDYIHGEGKTDTIVTEDERKGLRWAGISFGACFVLLIILCLGNNPFMADPATGSLMAASSTLMRGIVPLITIMFLVPGLVYGIITKSIKRDRDVVSMMGRSMSEMGPYIVLAFFASQFLALFTYSNLGIMIAIKGAEGLQNAGFTGIGLIVAFIVVSMVINMFIGSASAKWAIMAPIFVPMFMLLGFDPPVTQMAYRIGDSVTNPISPLFPYFPILLGYVSLYRKDAGMGTIISNMLPYSISFFIMWTILFVIFLVFGIPIGPN